MNEMDSFYHNGDLLLVTHIIMQALKDSMAYKAPNYVPLDRPIWMNALNITPTKSIANIIKKQPSKRTKAQREKLKKYYNDTKTKQRDITKHERAAINKIKTKRHLVAMALEARKFINKSNKIFNSYCMFIDAEPEWMEKKLWQIINKHDNE